MVVKQNISCCTRVMVPKRGTNCFRLYPQSNVTQNTRSKNDYQLSNRVPLLVTECQHHQEEDRQLGNELPNDIYPQYTGIQREAKGFVVDY